MIVYGFQKPPHITPPYQALIVVPVADLLGNPLKNLKQTESIAQCYQTLPLDLPFGDHKPDPFPLCPRVHQLRFNDTVRVLQDNGQEVCVEIPNVFFITDAQKKPHHTYWMLKENSIPLRILSADDQKKIPAPISFGDKTMPDATDTRVLLYPVSDPITGHTFSAGTRFICDLPQTTATHYCAYVYDAKDSCIKKISLPKKYCMPAPGKTPEKKCAQFISLLRAWAHLKHGHIAYVWGGNSFTTKKISPILRHVTTQNYHYTIPDHASFPKSGFDCTSLVATAAQLCQIPYFFKNSTTISTYLRPLRKGERLEAGDIILISKPSHVMIVSDVNKNLLIEARTHAHGYGFVHEIPLHEQFQEIHTYTDLIRAYHQQSLVHRLRKDGSLISKVQIRVFKLASVWE
jgi:cell wall-associated NlpC family hydrolase